MSKIEIQKISITEVRTDAIVNAANNGLKAGGGVCGAIFEAAGREKLAKECAKYINCETGCAVITSACDLPNKYIVHTVGPRYIDGKSGEAELLYNCYYKSLKLAYVNGCQSISFPLISAGKFGYPEDEAWEIAIKACRDFFKSKPTVDFNVVFASTDLDTVELGKKIQKAYPINCLHKYDHMLIGKYTEIFSGDKALDRQVIRLLFNDLHLLTLKYSQHELASHERRTAIIKQSDLECTFESIKNADFSTLNDLTVLAILVGIWRADHFNDELFEQYIQAGIILKLVKRMKDIQYSED